MITLFRILLIPLTPVYYIITILRNFLYDKKILKSYRINKPIISIGNITTGGTGKSPFTIYLADLLLNNNIIPAIVSRGYKRKSDEIEIVYDGNKITSTVEKCGDEPLMMAKSLTLRQKYFYIVTGGNRVETSNFTVNKFNPDIVILDDAYQHRKIKRNMDIVLIDAEEMINNKLINSLLLPAGNLRESFNNLKGADVIIQNNKFKDFEVLNNLKRFGKTIFKLNYKIEGFFDINNKLTDIGGKEIIAFAGIAKPATFFKELNKCGFKIINQIAFPDHYHYTEKDISKLTSGVKKGIYFITTEKDFIKISNFKEFLKYFNVLFMKIELNLEKPEKFFELIQSKVLQNKNVDSK